MEEKYYTPDLSEFRIGFKYQYDLRETYNEGDYTIDNGAKWIDLIVGKPAGDWDSSNLYEFGEEIDNGLIRVKYLDAGDIIACGFEPKTIGDEDGTRVIYTKKCKDHHDDDNHDWVIFFEEDKHRLVIQIDGYDFRWFVFRGYVKNISELKFILKAIGCE